MSARAFKSSAAQWRSPGTVDREVDSRYAELASRPLLELRIDLPPSFIGLTMPICPRQAAPTRLRAMAIHFPPEGVPRVGAISFISQIPYFRSSRWFFSDSVTPSFPSTPQSLTIFVVLNCAAADRSALNGAWLQSCLDEPLLKFVFEAFPLGPSLFFSPL